MRQWGEGRRLLIHCSLSHSGTLARLAEALPDGARAFDLPGHGEGPDWDGGDYQAQAVAMARAASPTPGPVLGHSFGGTVALRFAIEHPELVTSLTLVEPVFFAALRLHNADAYVAHKAAFAPIVERQDAGDHHEAARLFTTMWGGAPWRLMPQRFKDGLAAQMPLISAQHIGIDEDSGGVFAPGKLENLRIPVMLIRGGESPASVAAIQKVLLGLLPNAREHVIGEAGHMSPLTHPTEVAEIIAEAEKIAAAAGG